MSGKLSKAKTSSKSANCGSGVLGVVSTSVKLLMAKIRQQNKQKRDLASKIRESLKASQAQQLAAAKQFDSQHRNESQRNLSKVVVKKGQTGFGFTVKGKFPVHVSTVKQGSTAESSGLQTGDCIYSINGQNVMDASSANIATLIRKSGAKLTMEVFRRKNASSDNYESHNCTGLSSAASTRDDSTWSVSETSSRAGEWTEDSIVTLQRNESLAYDEEDSLIIMRGQCLPTTTFSDHGRASDDEDEDSSQLYEQNDTTDSDDMDVLEELDCLSDLMLTEARFAEEMRLGVLYCVRPLQHLMLTTQQHKILFQNIEKLAMISQLIVNRIAENSENLTIRNIYRNQVRVLSEAYTSYLTGLPDALRLSYQLEQKAEFRLFLGSVPLSLETFLERPVQHLLKLVSVLKNLKSPGNVESASELFNAILGVLRNCVEKEKKQARSSNGSLDSGFGGSQYCDFSSGNDSDFKGAKVNQCHNSVCLTSGSSFYSDMSACYDTFDCGSSTFGSNNLENVQDQIVYYDLV